MLEIDVINTFQALNEKAEGMTSAPRLDLTPATLDGLRLPVALTTIQSSSFSSTDYITGQVRIRVYVQAVGAQLDFGSAMEKDHRLWANLRALYTDSDRYQAGYGAGFVIAADPLIELQPPFNVTRFPRPQLYPEGVQEWAYLGFDVIVNFTAREC